MALFRKKEAPGRGLIGVDIGAGGIKAVELIPEKGRLRLSTYGYSTTKEPKEQAVHLIDDPKRGADILTRVMKKADIKSTLANASLPSHAVFHAIITIPQPKSAKEEIKPMIETQIRKLLSIPLEEMILDSTVIDKDLLPKKVPKKEKKKKEKKKEEKVGQVAAGEVDKPAEMVAEKKHIRILVSGAPKDLVSKYVELFKLAKLELVSLETEAFALIRSLIGKDKARIMIVDIGYERTNITIVSEGTPFLHRSIKAGGIMVTNMIAKQMGIPMREAEQTKLDLAWREEKGELPPVLKEAMMPILHEVKYALELYSAQEFHEHETVDKIIITGGSANLPQIDKLLTDTLNINVYLGDPWARIATPLGLRPVLDEIGPRFSVAVGLAMKELKK